MTLRLLLDENSERDSLIGLLRQRGYDVVGIRQLGHGSALDREILDVAIKEKRILYTRDLGFLLWASQEVKHPGIIVEHHLNKPGKDMTNREIANAIDQLERTVKNLRNMIVAINSFRR